MSGVRAAALTQYQIAAPPIGTTKNHIKLIIVASPGEIAQSQGKCAFKKFESTFIKSCQRAPIAGNTCSHSCQGKPARSRMSTNAKAPRTPRIHQSFFSPSRSDHFPLRVGPALSVAGALTVVPPKTSHMHSSGRAKLNISQRFLVASNAPHQQKAAADLDPRRQLAWPSLQEEESEGVTMFERITCGGRTP